MKQVSNKEYEKYQQYQTDKLHGRILTPDGLRLICAGLDNDPEKIGIHMLEMLAKFRNEGLVDVQREIVAELENNREKARRLKSEADREWAEAKAQFERELLGET